MHPPRLGPRPAPPTQSVVAGSLSPSGRAWATPSRRRTCPRLWPGHRSLLCMLGPPVICFLFKKKLTPLDLASARSCAHRKWKPPPRSRPTRSSRPALATRAARLALPHPRPSPWSRRPGVQPARPTAAARRDVQPAWLASAAARGQPSVAARRGSPARMPRRRVAARTWSLRGGAAQPRHRHADRAPPCTVIVIKRRDAVSLRSTFTVRPSLAIVELVDAFALSPSRREPHHVHLMVVCRGGEMSTPVYPCMHSRRASG
jgi:hypothetical protein